MSPPPMLRIGWRCALSSLSPRRSRYKFSSCFRTYYLGCRHFLLVKPVFPSLFKRFSPKVFTHGFF